MGERALDIEGGDNHLVGVHVQGGVVEEDGLVGGPAGHGSPHAGGHVGEDPGAMRPRMSVHTSLTSVVAQTMGRQFPGCAQSPFL